MSTEEGLTKTICPYCGVGCGISVRQGAEHFGIEDGDSVTLQSRRGEITLRANVTEAIKEGVVWTTPHFADASANVLTNDVLDERAKIPEYKAAAVDVTVAESGQDPDAPADD
ncbi:hypothetical protein LPA44_07525 [Halobacterium sp. KA-4]|uniref:molybdopterin dinucleotide binding domain-containing protein n=1 Tax=Halobacterium sp. KA-4 TaxID=2896367 RepID=UPI001E53A0D1|nr:molybdopterin dinucleotide binding domain-containing protein [Halobacterium sp. KA-4]MCD2199745.1 hypothetical protein [Halobacterium sp. KA-4]